MFSWLLKLFSRRKRASAYVSKSKPAPTPTVSNTPVNYLKPSTSNKPSPTSTNISNGYRKSPYSSNYVKPSKENYDYKPIKTTFENSTPLPQVTPTPEVTPAPKLSGTINFYETVETFNYAKVEGETHENVESSVIVDESPAQPQADIVLPKDGFIFIMNGYGAIVDIDGKESEAFIDMGVDVNLKPGQQVMLHHYQGIFDSKVASFVRETNTERKGNTEEILIQKIIE